jgi:hypothetical protein
MRVGQRCKALENTVCYWQPCVTCAFNRAVWETNKVPRKLHIGRDKYLGDVSAVVGTKFPEVGLRVEKGDIAIGHSKGYIGSV